MDSNVTKKIVKDLIERDLRKGLSKVKIGRKIGVSHSSIWNYLNENASPDPSTLAKIAKAYNVDISDLVPIAGNGSQELEDVKNSYSEEQIGIIEGYEAADEHIKEAVKVMLKVVEDKRTKDRRVKKRGQAN